MMLGVSQKLSMLVQKVSAVAIVAALLLANGMTQLIYIKYFMQFRGYLRSLCDVSPYCTSSIQCPQARFTQQDHCSASLTTHKKADASDSASTCAEKSSTVLF